MTDIKTNTKKLKHCSEKIVSHPDFIKFVRNKEIIDIVCIKCRKSIFDCEDFKEMYKMDKEKYLKWINLKPEPKNYKKYSFSKAIKQPTNKMERILLIKEKYGVGRRKAKKILATKKKLRVH